MCPRIPAPPILVLRGTGAPNLAHAENPLYLVRGVWIPEERCYERQNLFDAQLRGEMRAEIERAVASGTIVPLQNMVLDVYRFRYILSV